jgi:hypothetical protein
LQEFLDTLFGRVEKPAVVLGKRLAVLAAEMDKEGTAKAVLAELGSVIGTYAAGAADAAVRDELGYACALAGDCARQLGDPAAVRRYYRAGADFGSTYAARTLVRSEEAARDWPALLEAGELFFPEGKGCGLAFSWKDRTRVMRCRVLARAMLGDVEAAGAAFDILEQHYSREDAYGALLEVLLRGLRDPDLPAVSAVLVDRIAGALAAWQGVRDGAAALDDRGWWDSLDDEWKIMLLANCRGPLPEIQITSRGDIPEIDADTLTAVLQSRMLRILTIRREFLDGDGEEDYKFLSVRSFFPLSRLQHLEVLSAQDQRYAYSLVPLSGLAHLRVLNLAGTRVDDLAPLAGLQALEELSIKDSDVRDLSPLAGVAVPACLRLLAHFSGRPLSA